MAAAMEGIPAGVSKRCPYNRRFAHAKNWCLGYMAGRSGQPRPEEHYRKVGWAWAGKDLLELQALMSVIDPPSEVPGNG